MKNMEVSGNILYFEYLVLQAWKSHINNILEAMEWNSIIRSYGINLESF